jgi:predicted transcriptional regulator
MEKTTVYLSEEIQRGLGAVARRTGRPKAELIREALEQYLEREDTPTIPSWVGSIDAPGLQGRDIRAYREEWRRSLTEGGDRQA